MSTRCQIRIVRENGELFNIYHHFDGYFSGVGLDLKNFLNDLKKNDKFNSSECIVGLLSNKEDPGYESTRNNHGDIDYYYELDFKDNSFYGYHTLATKENGYDPWKGNKCSVEQDSKTDIFSIEK